MPKIQKGHVPMDKDAVEILKRKTKICASQFATNRRSRTRYIVKPEQYFVLTFESDKILGEVKDIGLGGLSIVYPYEALMVEENNRLNLVKKDSGIIVENIEYKNCYDFEISAPFYVNVPGARQRGIHFQKTKGKNNYALLEKLIESLVLEGNKRT